MLPEIVCKIAGHSINRRRVWDDSISFRTRCVRCRTPLIKDMDDWRVFDSDLDANPDRKPHPRFDRS